MAAGGATLTTIQSLLKDFYLPGVVVSMDFRLEWEGGGSLGFFSGCLTPFR